MKKTGVTDIVNFLEKTLNNYGIKTQRKFSELSRSQYIIISGDNGDNEYQIRISDHELPPSYSFDARFDINAGTRRTGANYWNVLEIIAAENNKKLPRHIINLYAFFAKKEKEEEEAFENRERKKTEDKIKYEKITEWAKINAPEKYIQIKKLYEKANASTGKKRAKARSNARSIQRQIEQYINSV